MTSLDFLYFALGIGFIILVIFISAFLLNLTITLRDVNKITNNLKEISDKLHEAVFDPLKSLAEITTSFGFISDIIEKIRSRFDDVDEEEEEEIVEKKSKGNLFSVKKLKK